MKNIYSVKTFYFISFYFIILVYFTKSLMVNILLQTPLLVVLVRATGLSSGLWGSNKLWQFFPVDLLLIGTQSQSVNLTTVLGQTYWFKPETMKAFFFFFSPLKSSTEFNNILQWLHSHLLGSGTWGAVLCGLLIIFLQSQVIRTSALQLHITSRFR